MISYIIRRVLRAALVMFGIVTIVFVVVRLGPGDPAAMLLPNESEAVIREYRRELGLDQPLHIQYLYFFRDVSQGNLGRSLVSRQPDVDLVMQRLPYTVGLAFGATLIAVVLAIPLGVLAAVKEGTFVEKAATAFAVLGQAVPIFWLGLLLIMLFSVQLRWFPVAGASGLSSFILPSLTLSLYSMALVARLVATNMSEVLSADYIRTARAKGLRETAVVLGHALRNSMIPVTTVLGLQLGFLLGGAVITETVFGWPGIGRLVVESITYRDYPVIQAGVLLLSGIFVSMNLMVDILYLYIDPRIKYS